MNRIRQPGFTLWELLVVIAILGIAAAVAIPSLSPSAAHKLDLAAEEVADALRYARSEALRTGVAHSATTDLLGSGRITLHRLDTSGPFPVSAAILQQPFDKKNYDFNVTTAPMTAGVVFTNTSKPFEYALLGKHNDVYFDTNGVPFYIDTSGTFYRLINSSIQLSYRGLTRTVVLAPVTGRVTIQ